MTPRRLPHAWHTFLVLMAMGSFAFGATQSPKEGRISVAVAVTDIEPIVKAVGGGQVDTVNLFKGCILRKDLKVESTSKARLALAEAVVWTGFMNESAAISDVLRIAGNAPRKGGEPKWIDVSYGAVRTNQPTSTCFGYIDPAFASGDPFFWLNPENGGLIARNIAKGLGELRPSSRAMFIANAEAFHQGLAKDIQRWKTVLKPLHGLKVFTAQCGWQNFSSMGGPQFLVCKGTPGELPSPQTLLLHIKQMHADFILVDPNTPVEYAEAFRENSNLKVIEVASSIETIHGATSYSALFENLIKVLLSQAKR
ncbi:MAG TPA: zinc ABC transporter substrate-binding protein [Geothrix sp.]|nr:zinc ABC transporter substrate-binding protein [Geothrix sp.]